jgi:2-succinyl-6-hydroxy-2,4-cyclohexadiene-1-carboxylate synthase
VIAHLPGYDCLPLEYPFHIPDDGILIGYSMGGRIALQSPHPKIVLSAHPGLRTEQEKDERWKSDQAWIEKLQQRPLQEFLQAWYAQPLFDTLRRHSAFESMLSRRLWQDPQKLIEMLSKESLAHQEHSIPANAVFLHGQLDAKFAKLYRELKIPSWEIPHAGHAAHLEQPQSCAEIITRVVTEKFDNLF